jgi:hypothetical protein
MQRRLVEIRLRYCGGCNPEIARVSVVRALEALMQSAGLEVRYTKDKKADLLLLVNGCPHACLEEEGLDASGSVPRLSVQGAMLDRVPVEENELPDLLWKRIQLLFWSP